MVIGYTTGVFDLFHVGHVNLLRNARGMCDHLVVGVTVDDLVQYKNKTAVIPFKDRIEVVKACKFVDAVVPQVDMDKIAAVKKCGATRVFVGDDWFGTDKWLTFEKELKEIGAKVIYFPYTEGVSSTLINNTLRTLRESN